MNVAMLLGMAADGFGERVAVGRQVRAELEQP